jgi:gliding motility-associated-like protein
VKLKNKDKTVMKNLVRYTIWISAFLCTNAQFAQITGVGHNSAVSTAYTNGQPNDQIYIYCATPTSNTTGTLTATPSSGTGPFTFTWYQYNSGSNSWQTYATTSGATSTQSGLGNGGYFVQITDAGGNPAGCFRAWVFINQTNVDAGANISACGSFNLSGTASAVANYVYYNPPPNPLTINNTTQIQVCFSATHTWVSDLAFYLKGPASCGSPTILLSPNPGAIGQGTICNSGDNVNNLCFSSTSTNILNVCNPAPSTLSGTYGGYGPNAGTMINWSGLYGCDASAGGWTVQIYDCIGGDVGKLTNANITFNGNTACGPLNVNYNSGTISSNINDNSCTAASASIFTVPQATTTTTPLTLNNSISSVAWSTGATTLNTTVNPAPLENTWYYLTATDNFGCSHTDSVLFTNTCVCNITNLTANVSAPDCGAGTFSISGQVAFTNPPATGTLTVTNCSGNSVTFNAPFTSPINYTIPNITADGTTNCNVTATFSATPACTATVGPFTEPICNCFFSLIDITIGNCDAATNNFSITGTVEFQTPPATGQLVIQDCNGNQTTFNAPFTSPQNFTISNIPSNGQAGCSVTASFTADAACSITSPTYTNPASCGCPVDAGNFSTNLTGSSTNQVNLCFGDQINIASTTGFIPPEAIADATVTYDPGIWLLVYSCPPTIAPPNDFLSDPCFLGVQSAANGNWTLTNNLGNGSTRYYVPLTMYSMVDGIYSNVFQPNPACFDFGPTFPITYLPQITSTIVPNCTNGSAVVTVNGGLPQVNGSQFTASNLVPATASFSNTTANHGGTITITGLQHGDNYSFTLTDGTGCTHTVSGGPFVGTPIANAGTDATFCALTGTLGATPLTFGTGTWSGPAGISFGTASSPTSTVTATTPGTYTLTWTATTGAGCTTTDQVVVSFSNLQFNQTITNSTCGNADGQIALLANNGIAPYTYSIDNGATTQGTGTFSNIAANTYTIVVTDGLNCTATGTATVVDQGGPVINSITPVHINCNAQCTGSIAINATGATQFSIDNGATYQAINTFSNLCAGPYAIMVQDNFGCTATGNTTINQPAALNATTTQTNLVCANQCIGSVTATVNGGTTPYQYSIDNGVTNSISSTIGALCAGPYTVLITDALGCTTTANVTITEPTPITLTIGVTNATCAGQCNGMINSIPAGGAGNFTYAWSPASLGGSVPLVSNVCAGTYGLTVTDANGCSLDDNNIVVTAPAAVAIDNVAVTNELCGNDCSGSITINASGATSYSINNGGTFQGSNVFNNVCQGTYQIMIQDANNCTATETAIVTGPSPVSITSSGTATICIGQTVAITSSAIGGVGGFNYFWDNGTNTQNINVSPTSSMNYCVYAVDANGCQTNQVCELITLNPALSVIALSDQSICIGSSADISALASGGNGGPYTYTWNQGVGVGQMHNVSPNFTTTYTVTATDNCGTPAATASVVVTVNTLPNISFSGDILNGCAPVSTTFSDLNVPVGSQCLWSFGDGTTSTDCNVVNHVFTEPGCWDVALSIITPEGCPTSVSINDYVCVFDYPNPNFEFGPQPTNVLNTTINFTNTSENAVSYIWSFDPAGVNGASTATNPQFTFPPLAGTYEVCLIAATVNGCLDTICQNVLIQEEFIVYVPNAFTPDGDAKNPTFFPVISGIDPMTYKFMIFNRWGELIFESAFPGQAWDGTHNGQICQQDVYVWKLEVTDYVNQSHQYIGHVTLIR